MNSDYYNPGDGQFGQLQGRDCSSPNRSRADTRVVFCFLFGEYMHPIWKTWLRRSPYGAVLHPKDARNWNEMEHPFWKENGQQVHVIADPAQTAWGDLMDAENLLFQTAVDEFPNFRSVIFLSGDAYPLRSVEYLEGFLANLEHVDIDIESMLYLYPIREFSPDLPNNNNKKRRKSDHNDALDFVNSHQFMMLSRRQIDYLLEQIAIPRSLYDVLCHRSGGYRHLSAFGGATRSMTDEFAIPTALTQGGLLNKNFNVMICSYTQNEKSSSLIAGKALDMLLRVVPRFANLSESAKAKMKFHSDLYHDKDSGLKKRFYANIDQSMLMDNEVMLFFRKVDRDSDFPLSPHQANAPYVDRPEEYFAEINQEAEKDKRAHGFVKGKRKIMKNILKKDLHNPPPLRLPPASAPRSSMDCGETLRKLDANEALTREEAALVQRVVAFGRTRGGSGSGSSRAGKKTEKRRRRRR